MYKNLTTNQLILIAMAAVLLLLAAFAFYLLQDPSAPIPFIPAPATSTATPAPVSSETQSAPSPTRRTTYTPLAAFQTPQLGTPIARSTQQQTTLAAPSSPAAYPPPLQRTPVNTSPPRTATTPNPYPIATTPPTVSRTPPATTKTPTNTASATYLPGQIAVTGRVIKSATPVANVVVTFADDTAPRQSITNPAGHYSFTTLAPGASFTLTFNQSDNPGLTPPAEIASMIIVEGTLPTSVNPIDIPDIELSLNLGGVLFEPQTPTDGTSFVASVINSANPVQFIWSLYSLGGSYHVELGPAGSDTPVWASPLITPNSYMWDGTLTDGTHITPGTYWWRVSVTRSFGFYVEVVYTQQIDIIFN